MVRIYSSRDSATLGLLRSLLDSEGIPCEARNEASHALIGEASVGLIIPEIWILNPDDEDRAKQIVFDYLNAPPAEPAPDWTCPSCGETVEGNFAECWNCGTPCPT